MRYLFFVFFIFGIGCASYGEWKGDWKKFKNHKKHGDLREGDITFNPTLKGKYISGDVKQDEFETVVWRYEEKRSVSSRSFDGSNFFWAVFGTVNPFVWLIDLLSSSNSSVIVKSWKKAFPSSYDYETKYGDIDIKEDWRWKKASGNSSITNLNNGKKKYFSFNYGYFSVNISDWIMDESMNSFDVSFDDVGDFEVDDRITINSLKIRNAIAEDLRLKEEKRIKIEREKEEERLRLKLVEERRLEKERIIEEKRLKEEAEFRSLPVTVQGQIMWKKAERFISEKKYGEALKSYEEVEQIMGNLLGDKPERLWFNIGRCAFLLDDYVKCKEYLHRIVNKGDEDFKKTEEWEEVIDMLTDLKGR